MKYRATILGCGSSGGVPRIGTMWGACDPKNPKNRRRRAGFMVERLGKGRHTTVLVDTPPDLREQLLDVRADAIDGVLFTHDHADHTHGIDDMRMVAYAMRQRIAAWADAPTRASLEQRFRYCFATIERSSYAPIFNLNTIFPPDPVRINGPTGAIEAMPIPQEHGELGSLGFRFGNLVYSPDISGMPEDSIPLLQGLDVWIVDALRVSPHPSHFHLKAALEWIDRLKPKRAILTHMTAEFDYETLKRELPAHVEPAYDGMVIEHD